ncbi:MAG: site-specific integrase [Planctomycetes bacterium]|nr:site-specific integrase [Planctomycetota bacterium]
MASVISDPNGRKRIQFVNADDQRKTIRLGVISLAGAESIARHVEELLAAKNGALPIPARTALWLSEIGEKLRDKLVKVELVAPREPVKVVTVAGLVAEYKTARTDVKRGTAINLDQAGKALVAYFGEAKTVPDVNEADADGFYRKLLANELALNTARRLTGRAKQFFAYAVRKRIITANPFAGVKTATGGNPERQEYVPVATIRSVLDACPSAEWRLIVALSRYAGLRCPSEHLGLTWGDILWDKNRFVVRSPKTEHVGKAQRVVPIFPELYPYLRDAFEAAEPGQVHVINFNRSDSGMGNGLTTNWRNPLLRILKRAGVKPWPRLFHGLRASCQTDLANSFPAHVVCEWLGNSLAVAREHYLQVTEDHFQKAAQNPAHEAARNAARTGTDQNEPERTTPAEVLDYQAFGPFLSAPVASCSDVQMTLSGFEPEFWP